MAFYYNSGFGFYNSDLKDGVYEVDDGGGVVEILANGLDKGIKTILVSFLGAILNREDKKPSFFFGLNTAKSLGIPLISITDPVLALDDKINLGWYAGYSDFKEFPGAVAKKQDHFRQ
jgi:hypothetical protein